MTKTFRCIVVLLPCAFLLASCGAKPTSAPTPPMGAAKPIANAAPQGGQAMVYPSNPKRPANIPALGIPGGARRPQASGQ